MMREGKSAEDIAQAFSDNLNKAQAQMLDEAYGAAIKLRKHLRPLEDWARGEAHNDDDIIADFLTKLRF